MHSNAQLVIVFLWRWKWQRQRWRRSCNGLITLTQFGGKNACNRDQSRNKKQIHSGKKLSARNFENRLVICKQSAFYQSSHSICMHYRVFLSTQVCKVQYECVHYQMQTHIVALARSLSLPIDLYFPPFLSLSLLCTQSDGFQWKKHVLSINLAI